MVYREGERKFCMGEGTEDRTQAYMKHVVLEPEHEKEYAQPLLTLFDELLAWDLASGDSRIIFYTEGRGRLWENRTEQEFQAFAWSHVHPRECSRFRTFFSTVHMKELSADRNPDRLVYRQRTEEGDYVWVEVVAITAGGGTMLCYVRDMGKEEQKRYMQEQISSCAWMGTRVTMKSCRKMTAVFRDRCHIQEIMNRSWRHVSGSMWCRRTETCFWRRHL